MTMERLEPFIGTWKIEAALPLPPGVDDVEASTTFEWALDGAFVLQRAEISLEMAPNGLMVIAPKHDGDGYTQHYFDSRGVVRLYDMTFDGTVWTLTREREDFTPLDFAQRYIGTFEGGGRVIRGTWEIEQDGAWKKDFDLSYVRT